MRRFVASCVVAIVVFLVGMLLAYPQERYTARYDNIQIEQILNNRRLLKRYYECLIGTVWCTLEVAELKRLLPDALRTNCSKCTKRQKEASEIVFKHLIEKEPEIFDDLLRIYDPEGIYRRTYTLS